MGNITRQDLDSWVSRAYDTACTHGFHDNDYSDAHFLMLMITEISEAVEADRRGIHASPDDVLNLYEDRYMLKRFLFERCVKETVEDELADICIRIFDFCGLRNIKAGFVSDKAIEDSNAYELISGLTFTDFCFQLTGSIYNAGYDDSDNFLMVALTAIAIYCDIHGIDLKKHIELKMMYNELRPFKNGKSY